MGPAIAPNLGFRLSLSHGGHVLFRKMDLDFNRIPARNARDELPWRNDLSHFHRQSRNDAVAIGHERRIVELVACKFDIALGPIDAGARFCGG
jgi:hypothetical protein